MAKPTETKTPMPGSDDGQGLITDFDMEDDLMLFDEFDDDNLITGRDYIKKGDGTPSWRRVEMLREEKWLKSDLADFEFDELDEEREYSSDYYSQDYSF